MNFYIPKLEDIDITLGMIVAFIGATTGLYLFIQKQRSRKLKLQEKLTIIRIEQEELLQRNSSEERDFIRTLDREKYPEIESRKRRNSNFIITNYETWYDPEDQDKLRDMRAKHRAEEQKALAKLVTLRNQLGEKPFIVGETRWGKIRRNLRLW